MAKDLQAVYYDTVESECCVCVTSSFAPPMPPLPLCLPIASISSMNTMQGAFALASLNKSRTRDEPTPKFKQIMQV